MHLYFPTDLSLKKRSYHTVQYCTLRLMYLKGLGSRRRDEGIMLRRNQIQHSLETVAVHNGNTLMLTRPRLDSATFEVIIFLMIFGSSSPSGMGCLNRRNRPSP